MNPIDELLFLRDGGAVARFHTSRIRPQSVAEHSVGVAEVILHIRPTASAGLLRAALRHDVYEAITGDSPATAKWEHPELRSALTVIEERLELERSLLPVLQVMDTQLLKWADMAELVLYCIEEWQRGNRFAAPIIRNGVEALKALPLHDTDTARASELFSYLISATGVVNE